MTTQAKLQNPKLHTLAKAAQIRQEYKKQGKRFVLTNGCFDIMHPGHLAYLQEAKSKGDILWLALNSDCSVQALKGPTRPIFNEEERAYALAGLWFIDGITIFNNQRLTDEILALQPDLYVKAGDYTLDTLNREEFGALQKVGAQIEFLPFIPGYSTSSIIEKILKNPV